MLPGGAGFAIMVERYTAMLAATPAFVWLTTPGRPRRWRPGATGCG